MAASALPLLRRVAWLAPLGEAGLAALARAAVRRGLARGEPLARRGDAGDGLAVVALGRLDVARTTRRGERLVVRALGPGEAVGLSVLAGARHSADVVAAEPTELWWVDGAAVRDAFARQPAAALAALAHLGAQLGELTDAVESRRADAIAERVAAKVAALLRGRREVRLTHEALAAQVGASRENVSRALKALERAGLVRLGRGVLRAP